MAAPTYTGGSAGNGRFSAPLAAGATGATFDIDVSTAYEARLQVGCTFGAVSSSAAGLQVNVYELVGSTPVADSNPGAGSFTISAVASTSAAGPTIHLGTGKYRVKPVNLDATNGLTGVYATYDLTPAVA